jgi:hypothetical protein
VLPFLLLALVLFSFSVLQLSVLLLHLLLRETQNPHLLPPVVVLLVLVLLLSSFGPLWVSVAGDSPLHLHLLQMGI